MSTKKRSVPTMRFGEPRSEASVAPKILYATRGFALGPSDRRGFATLNARGQGNEAKLHKSKEEHHIPKTYNLMTSQGSSKAMTSQGKYTPKEIDEMKGDLFDAAKNGDRQKVETLLEGVDVNAKGVLVNAKGGLGRTALHVAAFDNHEDIADLLLKKGADIEAEDSFNQTPLLLAVLLKHWDLAEFLKKKGAKVDDRSRREIQATRREIQAMQERLDFLLN